MVKACGQFVMVGGMLPMEFEREDDPVRMLQIKHISENIRQ